MPDKYPSLTALKEQVTRDSYRIVCVDRQALTGTRARSNGSAYPGIRSAEVTILAPHGGFIEAGSSAIARAVAGRCHNLFDFQGLQEVNADELHVTSTNFRDPQLCKLLHKSAVAVAIHGMHDQGHKEIWLGGLNAELKELVLNNLRSREFLVNPSSPRYRGISPKNIVNLACHRGVQLELSNELLADLFPGKRFLRSGRRVRTNDRFHALVGALRLSISQWCTKTMESPCESLSGACCVEPEGELA